MIWRHALKNAILPVVTVIGIEFAFLIGGLVVTETVFNLPGLARFLVEAILWRDYPIVQNLVMFIAIVVIVSNLVVDMLYGFLDPRVRYGQLGRSAVEVRAGGPRRCGGRAAWTVLAPLLPEEAAGRDGGVLMVVILLTAVFADQLATHDPIATDAGQSLARPGADHWLGSDHLGRDIYSRVVHGARVSLDRGPGLHAPGLGVRRDHRPPVRLRRGQDGSHHPARDGHPAGPAAARAGPGDVGGARARPSRTWCSPSRSRSSRARRA